MTCINPPELDALQLAAYVDATAGAEVGAHVERCPHCAARAQRTARWQQGLKSRVRRATCPPALDVGEYHLGLYSGTQAVAIARHIVECPHCALELKQLRAYLRAEAASEQLPATNGAGEELNEYLGGLVYVITGQVLSRSTSRAGVRGSSKEPLTIEAGDAQIIIDVQPAVEGRATLLGQLASEQFEQWAGAQVELWQAGEPQRTTSVDDIGTFQIEGVLPQAAELLITSLDGQAIRVPSLDLAVG